MTRLSAERSSAMAAAALVLLMGVLVGCAYLAREAQIAYFKVNAELSDQAIEIEINRSFIEKYKDRVAITATFTVDKAMQNPVARIFDGDLHMSGRAPEIALPVVAEIANGAQAKKAVDLVHGVEGTGRPLRISGVWRIWPEHAGRAKEEQGKPVEPSTSNTPKHVFEIHPVTRVNDVSVLETFKPVEGYLPGAARETFEDYEKVPFKLTVRPKTVLIATRRGLWNDVEFLMEIVEDRQMQASGGRIVIASARDLKGDLLVKRLRMIFAEDTPPERAVRLLKRGGRLHVFGMPRVDFAEVSRRVKGAKKDPGLLVKRLPYEIIIQGVYKDAK